MATLNGQVYSIFDKTEDIVSDRQKVSMGLWSGGAGTLLTAHTSSNQVTTTGQYYIDVYNVYTGSTTIAPEVQFSLAYGHAAGSGSLKLNEQFPTRAIYTQYKSILLAPGITSRFTFDGVSSQEAMFISIERARIKETLDVGSWQFSLSGSNGQTYTLFDNSAIEDATALTVGGRAHTIISGTIAGGPSINPCVFGLVYPDSGIIALDPHMLWVSASVTSSALSDTNVNNTGRFFNALSGAMSSATPLGFIARSEEDIASTHYFVRIKNRDYNFTNNPSFVINTYGDLYHQSMLKNPTVYITTVGLYNDNYELLAVAKLSQPLKKTFARECLVRVKIDY